MNITYFEVTGTPLWPCDHCSGSRLLWFRAIRNSSGHLCSNRSFMAMDNI